MTKRHGESGNFWKSGIAAVHQLRSVCEQRLARCILLKAGQWALDCRAEIPTCSEFKEQISLDARSILTAAKDFARLVTRLPTIPTVNCFHRSAIGIETQPEVLALGVPKLVLTSPPYPGLHVLYHRWQVKGRRETPAPFWIAGTLDGDGSSFYTFGDRKQRNMDKYFENVQEAFRSISKIVRSSNYSRSNGCLFESRYTTSKIFGCDGKCRLQRGIDLDFRLQSCERVWRSVPGRKWYASQKGATGGSQRSCSSTEKAWLNHAENKSF